MDRRGQGLLGFQDIDALKALPNFPPLAAVRLCYLLLMKGLPADAENTVVKFGLGFLFVSLSFYVYYYTRFFADANGVTSLNIFTFAYLVSTIGELCLSPIGLSIMTTLSPKPLHGVMMGMWFLASAYGQYAAGLLGAAMSTEKVNATLLDKLNAYTEGYKNLALYALIAGVVLIAISPLVRKLMHEVH